MDERLNVPFPNEYPEIPKKRKKVSWNEDGSMSVEYAEEEAQKKKKKDEIAAYTENERRQSGRKLSDDEPSLVDHIIEISHEVAAVESIAKQNQQRHEEFMVGFRRHTDDEDSRWHSIQKDIKTILKKTDEIPEGHKDDHVFLKAFIEKSKRKADFYASMQEKITEKVILVVLAAIVLLIFSGTQTKLLDFLGSGQ